MQQQYSISEAFRILCRKIMALALMPRDKVTSSFNEIQGDAHISSGSSMEQLLEYFEDQWMQDIDLWNVSAFDTRTNNTCEGEKQTTDSVFKLFSDFLL